MEKEKQPFNGFIKLILKTGTCKSSTVISIESFFQQFSMTKEWKTLKFVGEKDWEPLLKQPKAESLSFLYCVCVTKYQTYNRADRRIISGFTESHIQRLLKTVCDVIALPKVPKVC